MTTTTHGLLQTIDHELRTPLTALLGHLELLADRGAQLHGDARWSWEALVRGATRLEAAVDAIAAQAASAPDDAARAGRTL